MSFAKSVVAAGTIISLIATPAFASAEQSGSVECAQPSQRDIQSDDSGNDGGRTAEPSEIVDDDNFSEPSGDYGIACEY